MALQSQVGAPPSTLSFGEPGKGKGGREVWAQRPQDTGPSAPVGNPRADPAGDLPRAFFQCQMPVSFPSCKPGPPETKLHLGQLLSGLESGQRELVSRWTFTVTRWTTGAALAWGPTHLFLPVLCSALGHRRADRLRAALSRLPYTGFWQDQR